MCMARQRAAIGAGEANWLRSAPVMPTKIMRYAAREPMPMRVALPGLAPPVPEKSQPKGSRAATQSAWSSASLTPMCMNRNAIEATAVTRWMPCATMRWRMLRTSRSWATRPQITEQVRQTSDRTPAPKFRNCCSQSPPSITTTGISSSTTAEATP